MNRPVPAVPPELGRAWSRLTPRLRECALATVLERAVNRRSWALRTVYPPSDLSATAAGAAQKLLGGGTSGAAPGPT